MFQMNAGYFLMQLASEKDKERVYNLVGEHIRENANGVKQVCFIGVIDPLNPRVEEPAEIAGALLTAAKYIPVERLGSTDDCGFSPFSIDNKPKHGSPDMARDIARTEAYAASRREREKLEMLFVHLKRILGLDRFRLRGPLGARDEFHLAATAQNLRKLAMLIPMPTPTSAT